MIFHARSRFFQRRGFALVVVLGVMVLLVVLAVGFLARVATERGAATGYQASVVTRDLADTAVSLVQGQINLATSQGSSVAWVSQPGMVRTFSGTNLLNAYKLYSADAMVAASVNITAGKSADEPPANWADNSALWIDLNAPVESGGVKNFPILDASASAEGFGVTSAPGATTYQPVPMPVRWLYVLRDGTLVAPGGSGNQATVAGETASNPIIGRIAFWTDDESCKVNVNTASEGTYWDVPRAETTWEKEFGSFQPAQREFQRYPGHPAMTSLSTVFSSSMTPDQIYSLVPKIIGGGSNAGTALASAPLVPDNDRLYASVDELMFDPDRAKNAGLTKTKLEQARFFLTTHSRAPETNLFNLPRIACWPIFKDLQADRVTAFDKLIAFCASTGTTGNLKPYYFQREKADSPTSDMTIARNLELYGYLQYLTSQSVPGFGGNFLTKYSGDRDQILTEIFDYIRSANLHDDLLGANKQFSTYWSSTNVNTIPSGHGWVAPIHFQPPGSSEMTMGFGRTFGLSELGIAFICNADGNDATHGSNDPANNPVLGGAALAANEKYVQAILLPELFAPMLGYIALCPNLVIEISGMETLTLNGNPFFPVASGEAPYKTVYPNIDGARIWGGNPGWRYLLWGKGSPARGNLPGDPGTPYPFISAPVKVPTADGTMVLGQGQLTVRLYAGSSAPENLIQTIDLIIPGTTLPLPSLVNKTIQKTATGPTFAQKESWWSFCRSFGGRNGRLFYAEKEAGAPGAGSFVLDEFDVLRTVQAPHGDFRLAAATFDVPDSLFKPHRYYHDTTKAFASNLCSAGTSGEQGYDAGGKYISSLVYNAKWIPDIPSDATVAETPALTGDYDNAIGRAMDGPLINKPDEGAVKRIADRIPYFDNSGAEYVGGQTFFSPNRQVPSPGMLGSLPSGVKANVPWRTLLFRPQTGHFGAASPADHLLLDLFWMPVVEPYAISDRFSTAGKINLNYQILPFTYIERSTGLRALLKSEKIMAIPNNRAASYKQGALTDQFRKTIDASQTLSQFQGKFSSGGVFRSASEICDIHIVPSGETAAGMPAFWTSNALTGDNTRERIYTTLYPRLTARSNTYTVHFRVQALRKVPSSTAGTWTEGKDLVAGEYRGSTTIERFINASNPNIPDYAADASQIPSLDTLDKFYKWRVVQNRQFAP